MIARLAYLGQVITAGGSFPSLRDLADYGATLAFDDAENLSDPRKTDPDKRTLLLAGNRPADAVPLKDCGPDQKWRTRYVNTFCPRLFDRDAHPGPDPGQPDDRGAAGPHAGPVQGEQRSGGPGGLAAPTARR